MDSFITKLKLIFVPFLQIAISTVCAYTFLNWLLFIRFSIFTVDDAILNIFAPIIAPGIPLLIWLRPRIKLLNLESKNKRADPLTGYIMLAWLAIGIPTAIAQSYLVTATGKLTPLDHISQINNSPKTKYYSLKHCYIDKKLARIKPTSEVSGKYNDYFDMTIFVPCPIFDARLDTVVNTFKIPKQPNGAPDPLIVVNGIIVPKERLDIIDVKKIKSVDVLKGAAGASLYGERGSKGVILIRAERNIFNPTAAVDSAVKPAAWFAVKYRKSVSNRLSPDEKQAAYKQFARDSQTDFDTKQLENFVYLDQVPAGADLKGYQAAVRTKGDITSDPIIVLSPVFEPFEARNGNKFPWIFGSLAIGSVAFMIALLFKTLKNTSVVVEEDGEKEESAWDWLSVFKPRPGYYATAVIIDLNLLVFIVMVSTGLGFISFDAQDLLKWGANYRPLVNQGEYWRLPTSTFLHGGVMHVLFNMYGLMFVGIFLEPLLGSKKFAIAYLATGLLASIASVWWHVATVGVGASGAIFGMYGIFLALLTTNLFPSDFKKSFLISTSIFVGYNLLFGLTGGIDNAAHIGGLLSGLIFGYTLYPSLKSKAREAEAQAETQQFLDDLGGKQ